MSLKLHVCPAGPIETNAYLLTDAARGEAVLIDAPGDVWADIEPVLKREGCALKELWLTHGHWDHMQGVAEVVRATGAKVSAHPDDKVLLETPGVMEVFLPSTIKLAPVRTDRWLAQGERIEALGLAWEVRHVPGHCPGSVLFWCETEGVAFCGDAIFNGGVGRTDFPGGSMAMLEKSIRGQIYTLPADTRLYPGHGDATTVAAERAGNPFVRG
ncbi:MAG: MBL fold metallo-hydrolase [Opitutaceae bacterium]|jgi:glyoxylase-like metal-dependent hydrolase (beta-lactamase superfamily II)|nr:MBL fold metallo-hydrolase [Opitutaceae bacterium]